MKKVYVVKEGRKKGIFLTWNDCKEMISGYSNASYKSFEDPYEAIDYLLGSDIDKYRTKAREDRVDGKDNNKSENLETIDHEKTSHSVENQHIDIVMGNSQKIEAYVDGSFDSSKGTYGSGIVIINDNKVVETISRKGQNQENISMRNVAGEIEGAMIAMEYAIENGYNTRDLYFDYNGIEKWCTGEWKTNKEGTKNYKQFYDGIKNRLRVNFYKVKAHSGVDYNELADKLAKESLI